MTLKQLEAFYHAARLGTFALAAARIHVTQSSLSKRIAELESDLGQPLFDRSSKRARLTLAGEALIPKAFAMLELEQTMRASMAGQAEIAGTIHLGLSELSATTWFPRFLERQRKKHPGLDLRAQVGLGRSAERLVDRGELDCAVIAGTPLSEHVAATEVAALEFAWMIAPALADGTRRLDARSFEQYTVISSTADSGLNLVLDAWQAAHGVKLRRGTVCNSMTAIVAMTVAGVGISFLPLRYMKPLIARSLVLGLRSTPALPRVRYSLIWRRDDNRHALALVRAALLDAVDFDIPNALWRR